MVTNDLGACEWFVWDLRRSGLIDRGQLDQIVGEFLKRNPRAEAPALAEYLVDQGTITAFQAERVLNGKTQGLVLGPYVLHDAIGQGSMGQVYLATSKNDDLKYAVKVLPRRSMWNVRLARRQVRSFGQFSQAAVVPFVDVGTAGGLHYLVWPFVEGQTLESLIHQEGRLSPERAALLGVQVAQGLAVAHQNSIFHGLVKPSNLMIGEDGQCRILDFGIGSLLVENEGESLVDTMSTANTLTSGLDCASPESILEPTNRTPAGDQYSLGCVLYYSLTGRVPFPEGSAVEKMMAHQNQEPEPIKSFVPELADGFVAVVQKLMAKNPDDRFAGTDEVVEALEPYLGELAGSVSGKGSVSRMSGLSSGGRPGLPGGGSKYGMKGLSGDRARGMGTQAQTPPPAGGLPIGSSRPGARPTSEPAYAPTSRPGRPAATETGAGRGRPMPSRASFQLPPTDLEEVALAPAEELPLMQPPSPPGRGAGQGPAALRASAGWLNDPDAQADREGFGERRSGQLGTLGAVAVGMVLMALVYFGAMLLIQ